MLRMLFVQLPLNSWVDPPMDLFGLNDKILQACGKQDGDRDYDGPGGWNFQ
jgi:hypothetical protein